MYHPIFGAFLHMPVVITFSGVGQHQLTIYVIFGYLSYFAGDKGSGPPDTMWVLPGIFIAQFLGMVISPKLQKILGLRMTTLLGCWIMDLGILLSSYAKDLTTFFSLHGLMFGTGIGALAVCTCFNVFFQNWKTVELILHKHSQVWPTHLPC